MARKIQSIGDGYLKGEFSITKICHLQFKYRAYVDKNQLTNTSECSDKKLASSYTSELFFGILEN